MFNLFTGTHPTATAQLYVFVKVILGVIGAILALSSGGLAWKLWNTRVQYDTHQPNICNCFRPRRQNKKLNIEWLPSRCGGLKKKAREIIWNYCNDMERQFRSSLNRAQLFVSLKNNYVPINLIQMHENSEDTGRFGRWKQMASISFEQSANRDKSCPTDSNHKSTVSGIFLIFLT